jgi:outer membrane protein TolC
VGSKNDARELDEMGLIRKTLRVGFAVTSPLGASVKNVNAESKKQRVARQTLEAVQGRGKGVPVARVERTPRQPRSMPAKPQPSSALKIAEERYARGEITREEFLQIKADLES